MFVAKLKFDGRQTEISEGVTIIGRASDNLIAFTDNSNISRYHAEIDSHAGDFWLIELGSSNGTKVNGTPLTTEILLKEGDKIVLGDSVEIEFTFRDEQSETVETAAISPEIEISDESEAEAVAEESSEEPAAAGVSQKSKLPIFLGIAGAMLGLALVFIIAAVVFTKYNSASSVGNCQAKAEITKPEIGDMINEETEIQMDIETQKMTENVVKQFSGNFAYKFDKQFCRK